MNLKTNVNEHYFFIPGLSLVGLRASWAVIGWEETAGGRPPSPPKTTCQNLTPGTQFVFLSEFLVPQKRLFLPRKSVSCLLKGHFYASRSVSLLINAHLLYNIEKCITLRMGSIPTPSIFERALFRSLNTISVHVVSAFFMFRIVWIGRETYNLPTSQAYWR